MFVGGIVGRSYTASITDCIVEGSVSAKNHNGACNIYLGGVIGYADNVTLTRCISSTVCSASAGKTPVAGGLVGYMQNSTKVTSCISLGSGTTYSYYNYYTYPHKFCAYVNGGSYSNCHSSVTYTQSFFTSNLGFDTSVWDLTEVASGKLPTLIQI